MVPLCYRSATVNGLKNPACILHAPFGDVQDANEMRTVEHAKRNETYGTNTAHIRDDRPPEIASFRPQKFTIFKIPSQLSSQPFSVLITHYSALISELSVRDKLVVA